MSGSPSFSFPLFQEQVHNALNEADEITFGKLQDDEQRVRFVARFLASKGIQLPSKVGGSPKNAEVALEKRNEGNKAFQKGDFNVAQNLYTSSLLLADDPGINICNFFCKRWCLLNKTYFRISVYGAGK